MAWGPVIGAVSVENLLHTSESLAKPLYHILAAFPCVSVGANAFVLNACLQGGSM